MRTPGASHHRPSCNPEGRGEQFSSGLIDRRPVGLSAKGTLLESAGGGGALVQPQTVPGIVDILLRPMVLEGLADALKPRSTSGALRA